MSENQILKQDSNQIFGPTELSAAGPIEKIAKEYACKCHADVNQFYDTHPYSFHLQMVVFYAKTFIHKTKIKESKYDEIFAACWCHDLIEDARQSYNDIKNSTSENVAELVFALTTEKGKTRKERANYKYYDEMRLVEGAVFIKICDRIANMGYSYVSKSDMLNKYIKEYIKEYTEFKKNLYDSQYDYMFEYIENTFLK